MSKGLSWVLYKRGYSVQDKNTRYYYKSTPFAEMKKCDHTRCWQGGKANETLTEDWGEYKLVQPLHNTIGDVETPYNLWPSVGLYLTEMSVCVPEHITECWQKH